MKRPSPPPNPPKPPANRIIIDSEGSIFRKFKGELSPPAEFNSASILPPVGCKLVIKVGDNHIIAERTGYIADRDDMMEYKLDATGEIILGRFYWIYP
ncbi:MAG: hypothetical protein ACPHUL_00350 [Marinomonas gallaica]